jgi:hypothetical protein
MLSYNNSNNGKPSIHYPDNLLFKIFDNKTNIDINEDNENKNHINCIIRDFIGDHQVDNLNKKTTNCFNALEEVQRISKENLQILDQQPQVRNIITVTNIPEEVKIKSFKELYDCCNEKLLLTAGLREEVDMNIYYNLNNFHEKLINKNDTIQQHIIMHRGFFFKEIMSDDFLTSNFFPSIDYR